MQLVHRRPAVIYCVILSMLYKFVMADGLKRFLVKWCQFFFKINLNLFKFDLILPKFLKFHIYRWDQFFFLTGIVNLGSNARQDSRVLVLQPTASNSFFFLSDSQMDRASILTRSSRWSIQELESRAQRVGSNPKAAMAQPPPAASTETKIGHHTSGGYLERAGTVQAQQRNRAAAAVTAASGSLRRPRATRRWRCPSSRATRCWSSGARTGRGSSSGSCRRCTRTSGCWRSPPSRPPQLATCYLQSCVQRLAWKYHWNCSLCDPSFFFLGDRFDCSVLLNPEVFLDCLVQVKEVHGRRSSITEVKRAIHLIVSSDWIYGENPMCSIVISKYTAASVYTYRDNVWAGPNSHIHITYSPTFC